MDEIGWVIERGDSEPSAPTYWTGDGDRGWSQNHLDAVRFARKQDAEKVSYHLRHPNNRICEHLWMAPRSPAPPQTSTEGG